jgi:hypothetical protein
MTFPLKLVPFEHYALGEFRNPMAYTIRLKFAGLLDRAALEQAIGLIVARHPLLRAHVAARDGELCWIEAESPLPWMSFGAAGEPMCFPSREGIDLARETGLRVWVRSGGVPDGGVPEDGVPEDRVPDDGGDVEMRFQFHHACCDGVGAYSFLEELLCAYDRLTRPGADDLPELPTLDESLLASRSRFGLSRLGFLLRLPLEVFGFLVGMGCYLITRPEPAHSPQTPQLDDAARRTQLDMPAQTFDGQTMARLRDAAREYRATLNDLLVREAFYTVHQWNLRQGARPRILRFTLPMNLRLPQQQRMPAANVVGMTLLDRSPRWYRKPHRLLKSIRFEMRIQKYFRFPMTFVRFCSIPWCMAIITDPQRPAATGVLSNMGRVFHDAPLRRRDAKLLTGELLLEQVESAPPVLPQIDLSFSALSYAGVLTVVLNYDRQRFTPAAAAELFEVYASRLAAIARGKEEVARETVSV